MIYVPENKELVGHQELVDAEPREVFIIACLLVPIIGIGLYPKIVTQMYDATITQLTLRTRNSVPTLREAMALNPDEQLFSVELAPEIK